MINKFIKSIAKKVVNCSSLYHSSFTMEVLSDFPPGPLDFYRKKASFDWKKLKIYFETEDVVKHQNAVYEILQNQPEYEQNLLSQSFDDERRKAMREHFVMKQIDMLGIKIIATGNYKLSIASGRIMEQFAPSSTIKHGVSQSLFMSTIRSLGTSRHWKFLDDLEDGKIFGCFCLTEIGHGSNAKGMKTRATFNKETGQFIMHSPNFEAAKCWAGGLGQIATHGVVFAQLYDSDGVHHGLSCFVVPIRDPKNLLPYPGITVGDMGEKIGLNGLDNGFLMFDNYYIPGENLLNKNGDMSPDGKFVPRIKDPRKRHGASLGGLSVGRVNITASCDGYGAKAITIAIRYSAVRKQFGPEGKEEIPILEYQSHQHRLLPYLAALYVIRYSATYLVETNTKFVLESLLGSESPSPETGIEIHVLSSASKPVSSWTFRDAIQESREACGGHGYLKIAGIGETRCSQDAATTYEGENHVLIQQTSNWLIKLWPLIQNRQQIQTPLESANFLTNCLDILNNKFESKNLEELFEPENIINAYQWLICYLLQQTCKKLEYLTNNGISNFEAQNEVQTYYAKTLAIAYIQHFFLKKFIDVIDGAPDEAIRNVLKRLFALYGLWCLEKHATYLYEGGYANGPLLNSLIHEGILKLCADLKDDAVSLVDVLAPPDFILNSVLGASDGQVYKRLKSALFRNPYCMSRPKWWREVINWKEEIKAKL